MKQIRGSETERDIDEQVRRQVHSNKQSKQEIERDKEETVGERQSEWHRDGQLEKGWQAETNKISGHQGERDIG